jgi:hypothetical protein
VLVHCAGGVSRSATVVLGYLMARRGMTFADALGHLRGRRPIANPNAGFAAQLRELEKAGADPARWRGWRATLAAAAAAGGEGGDGAGGEGGAAGCGGDEARAMLLLLDSGAGAHGGFVVSIPPPLERTASCGADGGGEGDPPDLSRLSMDGSAD